MLSDYVCAQSTLSFSSAGEDIYLRYILKYTVLCLDDFWIIHYHAYHLMIGLFSISIENLNMFLS